MNNNIWKWVRRYIIITLCYILALVPIFTVVSSYGILDTDKGRLIFGIILGVATIIVYAVFSYFMIKGKDKLQ